MVTTNLVSTNEQLHLIWQNELRVITSSYDGQERRWQSPQTWIETVASRSVWLVTGTTGHAASEDPEHVCLLIRGGDVKG